MTTSTLHLCMALIVAMTMKCHQISDVIFSPETLWGDVVNFDLIAVAEVQFTVATFPLLLVEEFSQCPTEQGVVFEAFTPIEHIPIIWAGLAFHLRVALDSRPAVRPEFCAIGS